MSRIGKIARLPQPIRNALNRRLQDGETGPALVDWLNQQTEVQTVLNAQFEGRPISEQNLSEWRNGGYLDWLRHEEARGFVQNLVEQAAELRETGSQDLRQVSDQFSVIMTAEMVRLGRQLLDQETDLDKRWQRMRELLLEISRLRRDDHRTEQANLQKERWNRQVAREETQTREKEQKELRRQASTQLWAQSELPRMEQRFGGGEAARRLAAKLLEQTWNLPPDSLAHPPPLNSSQIRVNQTKSNQKKHP